ncbi:DUF4815 domain-containing protein [bacterium]|nr:DUF4815 domain-containing protein [bacterium]
MTISRDTFDAAKNYKRIRYHQDRDLLDSELNEQQEIINLERRRIADQLFKEGAILSGCAVSVAANVLTVGAGVVYIDGHVEAVPGATLTYDPAKDSGADYVYVELLKYNIGHTVDGGLINPATGEPTAEREQWILALKSQDTSSFSLPNNVTERKVVPLYKFDRATGEVTTTVQEKSNMYLRDLLGTLPGNRITVSSITEDQLSFAAAEGLQSLLQNLAERTFDQAGSYLVRGFDSFLGDIDGDDVDVVTNAGRAYIEGYRLQIDLPTTTVVPKSVATKSVRGEQKTFNTNERRYALNSTPLKESTQVEGIVETTANVTRGSVGGGEDLLEPNPVVDIIEVSQGATVFQEGVDWQQSGNHVDWLGSGNEPAIGTTYTVRWTYTKQMIKGTDYVDGGWFGRSSHPAADEYYYVVTAFDAGGETAYDAGAIVSRQTGAGELSRLTWLPVSGALGYRVYRSTAATGRTNFKLLIELGNDAISYVDDGVEAIGSTNPPTTNTSSLTMSAVQIALGNLNVVNFGRTGVGDQPVNGSNCSIDYDYYLGRRDIIYATRTELKRLDGAPADFPKLPIVPEGTLALCSIDCPPNSTDLTIRNFGLTRVTMDMIHDIIEDVEALKYNDAQYQMNNELQNRDAQTKKGIYSDDFSNDAQSDIYHPEWSARIDGVHKFVAPGRSAVSSVLEVDPANSDASFFGSLTLLPGTERVLIAQNDWSEEKNINPYAVFDKPPAMIEITPNIGRRGQTGVSVRGMNFTPNVSNITVRCDGRVVATGVSSDEIGRATAAFTIPTNVRNGDRTVEMTDGTYSARTAIQINDPLIITRILRIVETRIIRIPVIRVVWRWRWWPVRIDPLAQTFSFDRNRVVSAVGVQFTAKDPSMPVTVQIRGVTTGLPNSTVLAEKVVSPSEITLGTETKIAFDDPFYAEGNQSYAVVLLTNSTEYRVRVATLGGMGQNGVITSQTYAEGVLLESSNAETWTPLNGSDLAMRIYGYDFQNAGVIQFLPITAQQFSDLNIDEYSAIPEGCGILWEYSMDGGAAWDAIVPAEEERLPNLATSVLVRVRFESGLTNDTPALNFRDVNLIGYLNQTTGAYITRENELTQGVESTKLYAQMDIPSGTTVSWFASNDGGATWEPMTIDETRPIDQDWTEYTLSRTFTDPTGRKVRYKAEMTGTVLTFPRIHSLGATLS